MSAARLGLAAAPGPMLAVLCMALAEGVLPPVTAWFTKLLIDELALGQAADAGQVTASAAGLAVAGLLAGAHRGVALHLSGALSSAGLDPLPLVAAGLAAALRWGTLLVTVRGASMEPALSPVAHVVESDEPHALTGGLGVGAFPAVLVAGEGVVRRAGVGLAALGPRKPAALSG